MQTAVARFKQYIENRYPGRSTAKHYMSDLSIFSQFVKVPGSDIFCGHATDEPT